MPNMGIPPELSSRNAYANIKMGPKGQESQNQPNQPDQLPSKEEILASLNGGAVKQGPIYKEKNQQLGKNEFLKLLTQQLQNQDPMKPVDEHKFAAELAQFSQLEQLSNINSLLEKRESNLPTENKFYAASFLGKKILSSGSSIDFKGEGTKARLNFSLEKDADKVEIRIFDKNNNFIGQIHKEKLPRGAQSVLWDGSTLDGAGAGAGDYTFQVKSWDTDATPINVETKAEGIVSGVMFENGETILMVDGKKVFLRDVDSFELAEREVKAAPPLPPGPPLGITGKVDGKEN